MSVTLEHLLKAVEGEEIRLVAGEGGMSNVVSWVHVVENTQISEFLEGQEIAFTTGVGLESDEDLLEIVRYNHRMNASAMIINVGPFIKEIPPSVINYGNSHDFPIFEVPWHVHMSKIMRAFSAILIDSEKEQIMLTSAVKNSISDPSREDTYIPTFELFHFLRGWSYCLCVIEVMDGLGNPVHSSILNRLNMLVERNVVHDYTNSAVMLIDNRIVIMLANYSQEKVEKIFDTVHKKVVKSIPANCVSYWGVGENTKSVRCIYKSYNKAVNSISLQRKQGKQNEITFYSEMGFYKILMSVEDDNTLKSYYEEVLGPLLEYDRINSTDLTNELKVFFECDCSVQVTAEILYMHRNSIRYKINKIEEILGISLECQEEKSKLMLAFCIENII